MTYSKTYSPCDDCSHSFSKNNQESNVCKICEFKQALDLINRQKAEIESKNDLIHRQSDVISEQKEKLESIYSEAIKEFAERLQNRCDEQQGCLWSSDIGAVLEEMVGAESG